MARKIDLHAERLFENRKVDGEGVRSGQAKYYWATELETLEHERKTNEAISGKDVLEIGCSHGTRAARYAMHCNLFVGVDISDAGIKRAIERNLPNATFRTCDAHRLPFADCTFDVVIVNALLHHLDLPQALGEIKRVLKTGGLLCALEPLGTNPIFNLYRQLTPSARTVDERPFTRGDLRLVENYFNIVETKYFGFTNILSAFVRAKILRSSLTWLDRLIAKLPVKSLFWYFCGFYRKA